MSHNHVVRLESKSCGSAWMTKLLADLTAIRATTIRATIRATTVRATTIRATTIRIYQKIARLWHSLISYYVGSVKH
jgi:hypothetical protein